MFEAAAAALATRQLQKGISPGVQASGPFKKIIAQSQRGNAQNAAAQKAQGRAQNAQTSVKHDK
jgi:hypothetical protein